MKETKLVDKVYDYIVDMIIGGSVEEGSKIGEKEICEELNVSRTPVREALKLLETENWVQCVPRKGAYVYTISDKEFINNLQMRVLLGPASLMSAVDNLSKRDVEVIKEHIADMENLLRVGQYEMFRNYENACHNIIVKKIDNELLKNVMEDISKTILQYNPKLTMDKCERLLSYWQEMLRYIEANDVYRACISFRKLMTGIYDYTNRNYVQS